MAYREASMRNLRRRLEALEKATSANGNLAKEVAGRALGWLQPTDVELLIGAHRADKVGRPHTEREAAARRKYQEMLERECRLAGLRETIGSDITPVLCDAVVRVAAFRFSVEEVQLMVSGLQATQQDREATQEESAAIQAYTVKMEAICQLAGFGSVAEFAAKFSEERARTRTADEITQL